MSGRAKLIGDSRLRTGSSQVVGRETRTPARLREEAWSQLWRSLDVRFLITDRDRWRPLHSLTHRLDVYPACTNGLLAHLVADASVRELAGRGSPVRLSATPVDQ